MKTCKNSLHQYEDSKSECPECRRTRRKQYRLDNPEKFKAQQQRKRERNPELYREINRKERERNREHYIWRGMIARCTNNKLPSWSRYGGRGITVCERWLDLDNFLQDMGKRPTSQYTIERIDNNGNYEPGNCKWATLNEQARNRCNNRNITYNNETKCITDWAIKLGISTSMIASRLDRGWSFEQILANLSPKSITYNGKSQIVSAWARELNLDPNLLYSRLRKGMNFETAINKPKYSHSEIIDGKLCCKRGHQYESTYKECPECKTERKKKWLRNNPEATRGAIKRNLSDS